jgi:hypothetical protein
VVSSGPAATSEILIVRRCTVRGIRDDLATINKSFLPTADDLREWHRLKWKSFLAFLENGFRKCGLTDIKKDSINYTRWFTSNDRNKGDWSLSVEGQDICVASYWPNSGSTKPSGITAPLIYYDDENPPASLEAKIVVFDIPLLPDPLPPLFDVYSGFEYVTDDNTHPTDDFSLKQWYQIAYPALFGGYNDILKNGKSRGGLVISDMGPARAAGVYMLPYESSAFGIPALYLDRIAGEQVRKAAKKGLTATVKLLAKKEKSETFFLSGFLPGKNYGKENDEIILLLTHTDGPNVTQENGALGILAVIHYFSHIPQTERRRTLLVVLDPQHYMPGRHAVDWFKDHPAAARKIVASMGIEHLGQLEYREKGDEFYPTGKPEVTRIFVQDNDHLIHKAIKAVKNNQLPRTYVHCPPRSGGRWEAMGAIALERDIPGYGFSTDMSAHWSLEAHIDKFDKDLALKQIAVATQLTGELMETDLKEIAITISDKENISYGFAND